MNEAEDGDHTQDSSYGNQNNTSSFNKAKGNNYSEEERQMFVRSPVGFMFRNNIWDPKGNDNTLRKDSDKKYQNHIKVNIY